MTRCFAVEFDGLSVMLDIADDGTLLEVVTASIECLDTLRQTNLTDQEIDYLHGDPAAWIGRHYLDADGGLDYIMSMLPF